MATTVPNTCPTCLGAGDYPEGVICPTCIGRSTIPIKGLSFKMFKEERERLTDIEDKSIDIKQKVDEIKTVVDEIKVIVEGL